MQGQQPSRNCLLKSLINLYIFLEDYQVIVLNYLIKVLVGFAALLQSNVVSF